MIIVADTGPLIGLAKIERLMLLASLADEVVIPPIARRELLGKLGEEAAAIDEALAQLLQIEVPEAPSTSLESAVADLDAGERDVILVVAARGEGVVVLMDDQAGRRVARHVGLTVTGMVGILLRLKEIGEVEAVTPLLERARERGYWLSDEIVAVARRMAGET